MSLPGPDGIGPSYYEPSPPPPALPSVPSDSQIATLQGQVTSAQVKYNQDGSTLQSQQRALAQRQAQSDGSGAGLHFTLGEKAADSGALQGQIDAEQTRVDADRTALSTAQANLGAAQAVPQAASRFHPTDATVKAAAAQVTFDQAMRRLSQLEKKNPANLAQRLPAAQAAVSHAQGRLDQLTGYVLQQQAQSAVRADQQGLEAAWQAYEARPRARILELYGKAQLRLEQEQRQLGIAQSLLEAGSAETLAAAQSGPLSRAEQQLAAAQGALQAQENPRNVVCAAPNATLLQTVARAQAHLVQATNATDPALLVAQNWSAYTQLLTAQLHVWEASAGLAVPGTSRGQSAGEVRGQEQVGQDVAEYQYAYSAFELSESSSLLNPQTPTDQTAASTAWDAYAGDRHLVLSDATIARQLQQLAPGQKANVAVGEQEIRAELAQENQIEADRPALQRVWDASLLGHAFSGEVKDPSTGEYLPQAQFELQRELYELQHLHADSVPAYNEQYEKIAGAASTQAGIQFQSQTAHLARLGRRRGSGGGRAGLRGRGLCDDPDAGRSRAGRGRSGGGGRGLRGERGGGCDGRGCRG